MIIAPTDNEKYQNYIQRILSIRNNIKNGQEYMEHHHIIPKSIGGIDSADNLIWLYAQEHYYAHKLLAQENPENEKLQYAWWNMCHCQGATKQRLYEVTAEEYEEARNRHAYNISQQMSGRVISEESKDKMSKAKIGKFLGENNPNFGNHLSQKAKDSISAKNKGRMPWNKGKIGEPHTTEWCLSHAKQMQGYNNPAARSVNQYDLDGNFIKQYSTIKEAMQATGATQIGPCCRKKQKTSGGFKWEYIGEEE